MSGMGHMDHSQMQGMHHTTEPTAETKEALEAEMKKTADQMKEVSGRLKKKSDEAKQANKSSAVTYTCRMHPEVQQTSPGKCPKCAMTLVRKEQK